ncbi:MAG: hypothetical protein KDK28_15755 [Maritimibacter sp.]|nr:hypothetical protein [Maritimibacter sp.]
MSRKPQIRHLERRSAGFFFRRRVPARILSNDPQRRKFFVLSLRTHLPRDAEPLARRLTGLTDLGFAWMTENEMSHVTPEGMRILTELARFEIAAHEAARALAPERTRAEADLAFQREQALQQALREALACGNREIAKAPLRDVARRLGVHLDEESMDYRALAYEATRVLLDVSDDRAQREIGHTGDQSVYFRSARRKNQEILAAPAPASGPVVAAQGLAPVTTQIPTNGHQAPLPAAPLTTSTPSHVATAPATPTIAEPVVPKIAPAPASPMNPNESAFVAAPALSPDGTMDERQQADWKQAEKREKALKNINVSALTPASQAAIAKGRGISVTEAFVLYLELKGIGYGEEFDKKQTANRDVGKKWANTSLKAGETAKQIWVDLLGDQPIQDALEEEVEDALHVMWDIPAHHGRSEELSATNGYRDLIERADEK